MIDEHFRATLLRQHVHRLHLEFHLATLGAGEIQDVGHPSNGECTLKTE